MNIVVCVKQVPDTTVTKTIDPSRLRLEREVQAVPNPFDEYAVEEALRLVEKHGGSVVAICVGAPQAQDALRRVFAMGVERGILVSDPALAGSDTLGTARALAAALHGEPFDLVICGQQSTDATTGVVPARLAALLGLPQVTHARKVALEGQRLAVERQSDEGSLLVEVPLPALVSVVKGINEPRYPSLRGIMAAKKKEIKQLDLAALGLAGSEVGVAGARTRVVALASAPARQAGTVRKAEGKGGVLIADFLEKARLI
ncbi:MAG: electron transfer flavoprotein subunit beta/FixA family protein [Chloroflexi bacterium]|nr:electron transfer flavoprotein subunit beta/FixA family protein [Chloroflexota bacterium]